MSFRNFKTDSHCVGGEQIFGDITTKKSKLLIGYCSI